MKSSITKKLTIALISILSTSSSFAQQVPTGTVNSQNTSGESNRLTVTLTTTHGVSGSSAATPDYMADIKANMIIGPGSGSNSQVSDTVAASLALGNGSKTGIQDMSLGGDGIVRTAAPDTSVGASGFAKGLGGSTTLNLDGSNYTVIIKPKDGVTPGSSSVASGQASGSASTTLQVDATNSNFVNTFLQSF